MPNLVKQGDLLHYDNPYLSHFLNTETNEHVLYRWVDYADDYTDG